MATPHLSVSKILVPDGTYFWVDTRYFPLLSVRLFTKTTVDLATTFGQWLIPQADQAASEGKKVIVINDFSRSKLPSADARKVMADDANRLNDNAGFGYWVPVVPNPLLRGVLTAVLWMVEGGDTDKRTHYATGVEDAVAKSLELYEALGHPLPEIRPEEYEFPEPSEEIKV